MSSGPYSHAVDAGDYVYFSGQTALNAIGKSFEKEDITSQTIKCFTNLLAVIAEADITMDDVEKVTVYLTSMRLSLPVHVWPYWSCHLARMWRLR